MNPHYPRSPIFRGRFTSIVFFPDGKICHSTLSPDLQTANLYQLSPFLAALEDVFSSLSPEIPPLEFPSIQCEFAGKNGVFDFTCFVPKENPEQRVLEAFDLTEVYGRMQEFQQERNESLIAKEKLARTVDHQSGELEAAQEAHQRLENEFQRIEERRKTLASQTRKHLKNIDQLNSELDQLFYRSSHDLRTPITQLLGLHAMLDPGNFSPENQQTHQLMKQSILHLAALNTSLCELGNIRIHEPKWESSPAAEWISGILGQVSRPEKAKIQLKIPGSAQICADLFLLGIILRELMKNAVDAAQEEAPEVTISLSGQEGMQKIYFADQGRAIPESLKNSLFQLFSKGKNKKNRFGLGLYKARVAAEKMGARLKLFSQEGPEKTFVLSWECQSSSAISTETDNRQEEAILHR